MDKRGALFLLTVMITTWLGLAVKGETEIDLQLANDTLKACETNDADPCADTSEPKCRCLQLLSKCQEHHGRIEYLMEGLDSLRNSLATEAGKTFFSLKKRLRVFKKKTFSGTLHFPCERPISPKKFLQHLTDVFRQLNDIATSTQI